MTPRIAVALVFVAIASLLVVEGAGLESAWLPLEEAAIAEQARGGASVVETRAATLYPLLLRPVAGRIEGDGLVELVRKLNALLWAALVFPAYALARRRATVPGALAAAALAALVPGAVYAT
ncbi:MAG: hypothetical protein ACRDN6_13055, partial [Gaiellaceae bacterium]